MPRARRVNWRVCIDGRAKHPAYDSAAMRAMMRDHVHDAFDLISYAVSTSMDDEPAAVERIIDWLAINPERADWSQVDVE